MRWVRVSGHNDQETEAPGDIEALLAPISPLSEDCGHFELEAPDFSFAEDTIRDMEQCSGMWSLYEEWLQGFTEKAKEDWITFRYAPR